MRPSARPTRISCSGQAGYRVVVVKQIHEQDCYPRLGPPRHPGCGLPLHNAATYSTLLTLVNYDFTITLRTNRFNYYDNQLAEFKTRLMNNPAIPIELVIPRSVSRPWTNVPSHEPGEAGSESPG